MTKRLSGSRRLAQTYDNANFNITIDHPETGAYKNNVIDSLSNGRAEHSLVPTFFKEIYSKDFFKKSIHLSMATRAELYKNCVTEEEVRPVNVTWQESYARCEKVHKMSHSNSRGVTTSQGQSPSTKTGNEQGH
nr:hypothetical protein BgiMline_025049 [Biomphalaria glabrata]